MKIFTPNDEFHLSLPTALKLGKQVGFSILDQGFFSGGNFLLNVLLARWLTPDEYGAFVIAFTIMLILAGIQSSLIFEPMMVYGPTKYKHDYSLYIKRLSYIQFLITSTLAILVLLGTLFLSGIIKIAITSMAIAMPFILSFWFFRQSCYLKSNSKQALNASLSYFLIIIIGGILLNFTNNISLQSAYFLQITASLTGILIILVYRRREPSQKTKDLSFNKIIKNHWNFGRWILPASLIHSSASLAIIPIIGAFLGLQMAGVYKAYQNLITPLSQTITALNLYFLPRFSKEYSETEKNPDNLFLKTLFLYLGLLLVYIIPIHFAGEYLINWLYGSNFYSSYTSLIPIIEIVIVLIPFASILGTRARALNKPKAILYAKIASATFILGTLSLVLNKNGVLGAYWALVIGLIAEIIVLLFYNLKKK